MTMIKYNQAFEHKNSDNCVVNEYVFEDKNIDLSKGIINDRYPDECYCINKEVKEIVYVLRREGSIL